MSHLTELERWTVIAYRNEGKSFASIAEELGHSKSTIARTVERFEEKKSVGDRTRKRTRSKLGRVIGQEIEETMEGKVGMSTRRMAKKLRVEHGLPISHMAVNKFLHAEGFAPYSRTQCTPLTDSQKRKRIEWCERFKNKRASWWRKAVFLDEKTFGATWRGNPKDDIVWGREDTIIPPRGVQAYQPPVKVALCYEGKSCVRTAHMVWTRLQQNGAQTRHAL
jgi:transposase